MDIPVADCPNCKELMPVAVEDVEVTGLDGKFTAVYCASCQEVINIDGDVEVTYFSPEELEKATNWRVSE
jgi:thiol-disulfide isomerase/thioredoxin